MIFARVTPKNPCPICKRGDWCAIGDRAIKCMRIQSSRPSKDGGWYHEPDGHIKLRPLLPQKAEPEISIDFESLIDSWIKYTSRTALTLFAEKLRLEWIGLDWLSACWSRKDSAWAFPMRDGDGNIIGIRLRSEDGSKWSVRGSTPGLFYFEEQLIDSKIPLLICEGPTSTAAAMLLGFPAVGRPSSICDTNQVNTLVKRLKIRKAIIVADHDMKWANGIFRNPGMEGAQRLSKELKCKHTIWTPPQKDIRDFLIAGGTRDLILAQVKDMLWS